MTLRHPSIGARVVVRSLAVLIPAIVLLEAGGWWLMRVSFTSAADTHLAARVEGVRQYIEQMTHDPPPEGLQDELGEFVRLTAGDALLEISDATGHMLCGPLFAGADRAVTTRLASKAATAGRAVFANDRLKAQPFRLVATDVMAGDGMYHVIAALPVGPSDEALRRFAWVLLAVTPLVLVLAGSGIYVAARRALEPVDRITKAAREVTVRDLGRRLEVPPADDELRRLTTTFNDMLARLEGAVADITRFTADAAHELRTPVALVRTTADVALAQERTAAGYRDALGGVLAHAERMSSLVNDLLVLARSDAGVEPAESASVNLNDVVRDVSSRMAPEFAAHGLALTVDTPAHPIEVPGAPEALARVFVILLDNAIRYTPNGAVRVALVADGARAVVTVIDTGIGVGQADAARVFDRFFRAPEARRRAPDGSGLGLAIARTIVERQGGTISLVPGPGGVGSVVRVELPC